MGKQTAAERLEAMKAELAKLEAEAQAEAEAEAKKARQDSLAKVKELIAKGDDDSLREVINQINGILPPPARKGKGKGGGGSRPYDAPVGTKLVGRHNGETHTAVVREGGIEYGGTIQTPSGAAMAICGCAVNGHTFWKVAK